jgi:DNA-binding NarL/FixJ family response regulator
MNAKMNYSDAKSFVDVAAFLQEKNHISEKSVSTLFFQTYDLKRTEQEIVKLLAKRLSITEIADQLVLQIGTVKNYLVNIFKTLNVQNRQEAIALIEMYLI